MELRIEYLPIEALKPYERQYCVYIHIFPNNKKYIGITKDIENRFGKDGKGYYTQPKMKKAIEKYGWNNIQHEVLLDGLTKEQAEKAEREFIIAYDSIKNGYNVTIGGDRVNGTYLLPDILKAIYNTKNTNAFRRYSAY